MQAIVGHAPEIQKITTLNPVSPGGHSRYVAAQIPLAKGSWVVLAKADLTNVSNPTQQITVRCFLLAIGAVAAEDRSDAVMSGTSARQTISLMVGVNVPQSAAGELSCAVDFDNKAEISNITLTAIPVESVN